MNPVKINTSKQLEKFLKILAEESVMAAQSEPEQSRQKELTKKIKQDKAALSEEEPDKAPPAPQTKDATDAPPPPPANEPEKAAPPAEEKTQDLNPTLDSLIRAIKEIRSGFGSGDSSIETELSRYFDRLDDAERVSLVVMLRSLGDIMRKESDGSNAMEPSQYNVVMSMKAKEQEAPSSEPAQSPEQPAPEPEDTAPPIRVGEPVSEAYRAKIRSLLKRSV